MIYFNNPPKASVRFGNVPEFIKKWYPPNKPTLSLRYILSLIEWAEKEFNHQYNYLISIGNEKAVKFIRDNKLDCLHFLAQTKEFEEFVKYIDSELWDTYPNSVKNSLITVGKYYKTTH